MEKRLIIGRENQYYALFLRTVKVDTTNLSNFEPNYLSVLMAAYDDVLDDMKEVIMARILEMNSNDPVEALHFLETYKLGLVGTE